MNTPNKLTLVRIALVPFFLFLLLAEFPFHYFGAFLVFGAASLTDYFDGMLARRDNLVTDFGKFLDPIADKLLTTAALLGFVAKGIGAGTVWVVFLVLAREFLIGFAPSDCRCEGDGTGGQYLGQGQNGVSNGDDFGHSLFARDF